MSKSKTAIEQRRRFAASRSECVQKTLDTGARFIDASIMTFDPKIRLTESEEPDPLGLRFDTHDDALNYIDKLVERSKNFLSSNKLDFVEYYKSNRLVINLEFITDRDLGKYQLVFAAIPSRRLEFVEAHPIPFAFEDLGRGHHRVKDSVLISVSKAVQCPKEIVPSFVWLTPAYQVTNILRQFSATTFKGVLKLGLGVTDGKISRVRRQGTEVSNGADSLVQGVTEIDSGVAGVSSNRSWHRFTQLELDHLPDAVTACLGENGAGIFVVDKIDDLALEFQNVILSPRDAEL